MELPEVTSPKVTGNSVTVCHVIRSYRMRNPFLRFFLTIVVGHNVPLRMTDMATGCDVIKHHVTAKGVPLEGWGAPMRNRKLRNIRQRGLFTGSDVIKRHVIQKGFPWKGGVCACATGSRGVLPIIVFLPEMT